MSNDSIATLGLITSPKFLWLVGAIGLLPGLGLLTFLWVPALYLSLDQM